MKALGPLAVAERDIRARTAAPRRTRADRARSGDYTSASGPRPFSPPGKTTLHRLSQPGMLGSRYHKHNPGGLEGRDGLAGSEATGVASATPIRAGGAESADMSLSDRERVEGFHRTTMTAVRRTPDDSLAVVCLTPPTSCASRPSACDARPSRDFVSRPSQGSGTLDDARHGGCVAGNTHIVPAGTSVPVDQTCIVETGSVQSSSRRFA